MKLGLHSMRATVNFGMWGSGVAPNIKVVQMAERLGYSSVWTAEASGSDAVVPAAWLAAHTAGICVGTAIMQISARPPTVTAMTAATLDRLSEGRFLLGLGVSGPVVVEGWHGSAFGEPLVKTREYLRVVRSVLARQTIDHSGSYYTIPYRGEDATGLAGPVKLMFRPRRPSIPIFIAAMGPANVRLAHEVADGVIPAFYSPRHEDAFFSEVDRQNGRRIEIAPFVAVALGSDVQQCRDRLKPGLAFWIGGMGARGLNFYNNWVGRMGYEKAALTVQELYTTGRRAAAAASIPDELVDDVALCGPRERIRDQLEEWKGSSVTTMILNGVDIETIRMMAELVL